MTKRRKFPPGRCILCLDTCDELTGDHAIPKAWYPDSTPADLEKWQAPACTQCNGALGVVEDRVLRDLRLAVNPHSPEGYGVANKAVRAVDPSQARNARDRRARARARDNLKQKIQDAMEHSPDELLRASLNEGEPSADSLPMRGPSVAEMDQVLGKMARGLIWALCDNSYIEADQRIEVQPARVENPDSVSKRWQWFLKYRGVTYERGPDVTVRIMEAQKGPKKAIEIVLWRKFSFFVFVSPQTEPALLPNQYTSVTPEEWMSSRLG